jgi:hypothetical protein
VVAASPSSGVNTVTGEGLGVPVHGGSAAADGTSYHEGL